LSHQLSKGELKMMDTYQAVGLAEGFIEADTEEQVLEAWQTLVDTGMAWQLQGWFGRTARHLIEEGYIHE
jgi:hypothetical protein